MYLQLKKNTHIDKTLSLQLRQEPSQINGKMNQFNNLEYHIPVINIGDNYTAEKWGDKDPITFKKGDNLELKCSSALYNKLVDYSKGELVDITMIATDRGVTYKVSISEVEWDKPVTDKEYHPDLQPKSKDIDMNIKWGMAFNNATRLVSNINTDENVADKVALIKDIMPKMFEIACGMDALIHSDVSSKVDKNTAEDDDLPF